MRAELTAFGAQVLALIKHANEREWKHESTPTSLLIVMQCPERDLVNTLNWLHDLSLVDEKDDPAYLDGRYYTITDLGVEALRLYDEAKGRVTLPPPKIA